MEIGIVKWYNHRKGYGFIAPPRPAPPVTLHALKPGSMDIFVHNSDLDGLRFQTLDRGDLVTFDLCQCQRGPKAVNVRRI